MKKISKMVLLMTLVFLVSSIIIIPATAAKPKYFIGTVKDIKEESFYDGSVTAVNVIVLTIPIRKINSGTTIEYYGKKICRQLSNGNYLMIAGLWLDS